MSTDADILQTIIDRHFKDLVALQASAEKGKSPGILVGVSLGGGNKYYFSYGEVPVHGGTPPATEDIVMLIGSNTKVFTATLLALATTQSTPIAITLDTAVSDLVPNGTTVNLYDGDPILLWHLATHSAGYPKNLCGQVGWGDYTFDEMASFLDHFTPPYQPGTYWFYSDQGFALLGALLSHAYTWQGGTSSTWDPTYQAWSAIATNNILKPLGMPTTQVDFTPVIANVATPFDYVADNKPYKAMDPPLPALDSAGLGAGALSSTLSDMLTFLQHQIIPPGNSLGMAIRLTQQGRDNALSMGLGWQIGNGFFYKNGLVSGYASYMAFDPVGIALIAIANSRGGDDGGTLCNAARAALGDLRGVNAKGRDFPPPPATPTCP
jgi:CubicO group peptidase (beta-lactamase class C family)